MPYSKVYIHLVWTTKKRNPYLTSEIRQKIQQHIISNALKKGIYIDVINGHLDHMHSLISLGNDQKLSEVVRLIKGESSHWVNKNNLISGKFGWQEEFYAMSVSESSRLRVINYIKNQDTHHRKKTFQEEFDEIMRVLGVGSLG